jgi:hypothetical protein
VIFVACLDQTASRPDGFAAFRGLAGLVPC